MTFPLVCSTASSKYSICIKNSPFPVFGLFPTTPYIIPVRFKLALFKSRVSMLTNRPPPIMDEWKYWQHLEKEKGLETNERFFFLIISFDMRLWLLRELLWVNPGPWTNKTSISFGREMYGREKERECEWVCVCVWERERESGLCSSILGGTVLRERFSNWAKKLGCFWAKSILPFPPKRSSFLLKGDAASPVELNRVRNVT